MIVLFSGSGKWLAVHGAAHVHSAQAADLSAFGALAPASASHVHSAGNAALSIQGVIQGASAFHVHGASESLVIFADFVTPDLIVETGEVVPGADSFISLEAANQYFRRVRGLAWRDYSNERRKAALRSAAEFLSYAYKWIGDPEADDQPLSWPRRNVPGVSWLTVPGQVIRAQLYLAEIAAERPLGLMDDDGRQVVSVTERLDGVGSTQTTYGGAEVSRLAVQRYPRVEAILAGLIVSTIGTDGVGVAFMVRH
jgi:hypothetical protein